MTWKLSSYVLKQVLSSS